MKKFLYKISPIFSVLLVIIIWWIASISLNIEFLLPSPYKTLTDLWSVLGDEKFYLSAGHTLLNALFSFSVSLIFAFLLALISSFSKLFERLLSPLVLIVRVIPTMSVVFLSIIWLTSDKRPHFVVMIVVFPMLYASFLSAIKGIDGKLKEVVKVYNVPKKEAIFNFYLPYVVKATFDECVATLSFSVKLSIAGEAIAVSNMTLGFLMQSANANLETGLLIAYTVAAVVMGFVIELFFKLIGKIVVKVRCHYART